MVVLSFYGLDGDCSESFFGFFFEPCGVRVLECGGVGGMVEVCHGSCILCSGVIDAPRP
jgi:hypothetical protein